MKTGKALLLTLFLLVGWSTPAWALFGCTQQGGSTCTDYGTRVISGVTVGPVCWTEQYTYSCYTGQQTNSCSAAQLSGCYLNSTTCTQTISDGNCVQWAANYICPGDSSTSCVNTGGTPPDPGACQTASQTCNTTDNSTCVSQTTVQVCPATTTVPACNTQSNCTLSASTCTDNQDGVCDLENQTYTCGLSKQVCTQSAEINQCDQNMTEGLGTPQTQNVSNNFQEAATYMGILNAISKDMTPGNLTIFPGQAEWCTDPILNGLITNNCCNTNITGKGGNLLDTCTTAEQQLNAARRANRTVYIGQWCNQKIPLIGLCISKKQGYCQFDSVLAKIIQQQGRAQIAQLMASGYAAAQSGPFNFPYFTTNGGWGPQTVENGNTVAAWQWPTYCEAVNGQVDLSAETAAEQNGGIVCPSMPAQWFAVCDSGTSCGALPSDPRDGSGGDGWTVQNVDPQTNSSYSLDNYTVATGACNLTTGACAYTISAWPAGSGGAADLSMNVGWALYQPGSSTPTANSINQLGSFEFQGVSIAGSPSTMPATVPFNYSLNNGATWQQVQLPTNLPIGQASLGSNISIFGNCNPGSFQCEYTVKAPVSVATMPWGTPQNPQCEGFNTAQLSVLDFNKMNLSQYIQSITPASLNQTALAQNTASDAQSFYSTFTSGGSASSSTPQSNTAAYICDNFNSGDQCQDESASGQGPFQVELNATTVWPPATGPAGSVTGVSVNWGDGSSSEASVASGLFVANHTYPSVNTNTTYQAVVTFNTVSDGTQTVDISVEDAAVTVTANSAANTGGGLTSAPNSTYVPSELPNGNTTNNAPGVPAGTPQ